MDPYLRKARRMLGLPAIERNCRRKLDHINGRSIYRRAYLVSGTVEAGEHAMLTTQANRLARELQGKADSRPIHER